MRRNTILIGVGVVLGLALEAAAQAQIYALPGDHPGGNMGRGVAAIGDLDGDGVEDVGACGLPVTGVEARIRVWSGKTGALLLEIVGDPAGYPTYGGYTVIAPAGDVDADGVPDILAANPHHKLQPVTNYFVDDVGAVWVYSGADGSLLHFVEGYETYDFLGSGIAGGVDLNQDGHADFAIGIPGKKDCPTSGPCIGVGGVSVRSGKDGSVLYEITEDDLGSGGGYALSILNDINGDGIADFVTRGSASVPAVYNKSMLRWFSGADGSTLLTMYPTPGTPVGFSLASAGDVDGDGLFDVVVGSPNEFVGPGCFGTARVLSSADAGELMKFLAPACGNVGQSVAGLGDFDGDGVPDVAVGTPQYVAKAYVVSGATGQILYEEEHDYDSYFGYSVAGPGDLNDDGLGDLAIGWANDHSSGMGGSSVRVYLGGCAAPTTYCAAKTNSQGCQAQTLWSGLLSLSIADNFQVRATRVISSQLGMLIWSLAPASTPFQGGTLCLAAPIHRLAPQSSGGSAPSIDCSGQLVYVLTQDMAAQQGWTAGQSVHAQFWYRDPAHPDQSGVGLTNAITFPVCP